MPEKEWPVAADICAAMRANLLVLAAISPVATVAAATICIDGATDLPYSDSFPKDPRPDAFVCVDQEGAMVVGLYATKVPLLPERHAHAHFYIKTRRLLHSVDQ